MKLGAFLDEKGREVVQRWPQDHGIWYFDEDDFLLFALICDSVYAAELLWEDPANREYSGVYTVRDYQYPLFRAEDNYCGFTCARSVGKTESVKARAFTHAFRRQGENLLVTAPELIHLLPLTDAIEDKIRNVRLTREFLDMRGGKTGFTHRPFGVDYVDGTAIVGRIPRLTGTGVKGQHQPDLLVDEAQDYPEKGWVEVHERLSLETVVPTPRGDKLLGKLRKGDHVFGLDGAPTRIVGLSPVETEQTFTVRLDDGSEIVTDASHRWTVTCNRYLKEGRWLTKTTQEISADLLKSGKSFGSLGQPWLLPDVGPAQYPEARLPLDPYTLGVLIGDGSMRGNLRLSIPPEKEPVRAECQLAGRDTFSARAVQGDRCAEYGIVGQATKGVLTGLGLMGTLSLNKFIPAVFMHASVEQRLALLQGLVDTDGNVHRSGAIRYVTSSDRLADDVELLVRSLGGRLSRSVARNPQHKDGWLIYFRLPAGLAPARVRTGWRPAENDKLRRRIVAVEPTGRSEDVRCLMVDNPDHLFLVADYVPTRNTVLKDHTDHTGAPDFTYHFYGVHSGARDSGFFKRAQAGGFRIVQVTALQRSGWSKAEKDAAKAAYGGTQSPDYRRNILGEPGAASSAFFVTARLVACLDQDRDSAYNQSEYVHQDIRVEEFDELGLPIADVIDLPSGVRNVWGGMDIGLTNSPTVIMLFCEEKVKGTLRLKLIRRIHLERMRTRQIREAMYAIGWHFGSELKGFGSDITGLGFPMFQEMEDDEACPPLLRDVHRGFFFNAKVPVGVDKSNVTKDSVGNLRDHLGGTVTEEYDPLTAQTRFVTSMPMIEASTRYLREFVDQTFLLLPFDVDITSDMQGETQQRVRRISGLKSKPNAFHILDAMRGMAMAYKSGSVEEALSYEKQTPVLESTF